MMVTTMEDRYPAHEQLLFLCARSRMDDRVTTRARWLTRKFIDWQMCWKLACRHSIAPLVARNLRRVDDEARVPPAVMRRFTRAYRHNALRQALRAETLARILSGLHAADIPVLALKGTALAHTLYPDPALRVCGDVDLLVRPDDLSQARQVLSGIDYDFMIELADDHYDFWVGLPGKWVVRRPDWETFWDRAVSIEIAGAPALVLPPTDLVISLCINVVRRGFTPFKLLVDIAELVRRDGETIAWDMFQRRAHRSGLDRFTWHVFRMARSLLGAPVPTDLLAPPDDLGMSEFEARLLAHHRAHALSPLPVRSLLTLTTGGALHRIRALKERLFPSPHWLASVYERSAGDSRIYLDYLRWPFDLWRRYGPCLVNLLADWR